MNWLILLTSLSVGSCKTPYKIKDERIKDTMLTPTFSILTDDDIKFYAWIWNESEPGLRSSREYWTCHAKAELKQLECQDFGYDKESNEHNSEFRMKIQSSAVNYDIGWRRAPEIKECKRVVSEMKRLLAGQTHFCVGVAYLKQAPSTGAGQNSEWIFDKFKTKKGCVSFYADQECDIDIWRENGFPNRPYEPFP